MKDNICFILSDVGWLIIENQFSLVFFWNLEKEVALLKELNSLAKDGIIQNNKLKPIYQNLVEKLAGSGTPQVLLTQTRSSKTYRLKSPIDPGLVRQKL